MKKLFTLLLGLMFSISLIPAQEYWNQYLINENFDGKVALPTGWSYTNNTSAVYGRGGGISYVDGVRISGAGSGNRGGEVKFPLTPDSSTVYVDFDLKVVKSTVNYRNTFQIYLLGSKSANVNANDGTQYADVIGGLFWVGSSGKFHVWNKDIKGPSPIDSTTMLPNNDTIPVFVTGQYPSFRRAGTNTYNTDSMNLSTKSEVGRLYNAWYTLTFKLNFVTKKMDVTITQKDSLANTQTFTDLDFVSKKVTDVAIFGMVNNRASNQGNASNADLDATVDNFKVYQKVLSLGKADVTIKYQDLNGITLKPDRVDAGQEVSLNYKLWESDKLSFIKDGTYYSYDSLATGSESVNVALGGSTIIVKFDGAPATAGPYIWKGTVSEFWNEQDANFTTNNTNQLAYQIGNDVQFSDPLAPIKEVTLNKEIDMGTGNLEISAPGYTINGTTGLLKGTGNINVNASTRLGFINTMSGHLNLNMDTLYLSNMQVTDSIIAKDGTKLNVRVGGFNKPVIGNGGTFTLIPGSVTEYTGKISGFGQVNYDMQVQGNLSTYSSIPRMNTLLDSLTRINVSTQIGDTALFGTTINYPNNAINLGDSIIMVYNATPATSGSIITLGELSGTAGSALKGPFVRKVTYRVGSLNTDAAFAGKFIPHGVDAWNGATVFSLEKIGKGIWTLSGNSPDFGDGTDVNGAIVSSAPAKVSVLDGTLLVSGILSKDRNLSGVEVADSAKLVGNGGFIGANAVTINGGLEGTLHFGGSLSLEPTKNPTTTINVDGTNIDKITVDGDLNYGGTLVVKVTGTLPPVGDYQIFQFANYFESGAYGFDAIQLPSENWTYNYATGVLSYKGGDTAVKGIDSTKEVESIDYFDLTGKKITKNYEGFMILRVKYTDGTSNSFKTFKKFEKR